MSDMSSLLQKMTSETSGEVQFDAAQVNRVVEILIPRMATGMPGMPKGMKCDVERDADGKGWTIRVRKP